MTLVIVIDFKQNTCKNENVFIANSFFFEDRHFYSFDRPFILSLRDIHMTSKSSIYIFHVCKETLGNNV